MEFKVGQTVELVDKSFMTAPLGSLAVVTRVGERIGDDEFISIVWKLPLAQSSGNYWQRRFKPVIKKGQQLLFSFMGE